MSNKKLTVQKDQEYFYVKSGEEIIDEFTTERTKQVKAFNDRIIFVERKNGEVFILDTKTDKIIAEGFSDLKYLENHNLLLLDFCGEHKLVCLCNCKKSSCFEGFRVDENGLLVLENHATLFAFDPQTGEEFKTTAAA